MRLLPKLVITALLTCGVWWYLSGRPIHHPPGVLVPNEPVQKDIAARPIGKVGEWNVMAVAEYHLRGRVLGTKRYRSGPQSELVPVDVAVGWGRMSDQAVIDGLTISMTNRFYFYEWENQPPIPQDEIKVSSANNHVIAANDEVRKVIGGLRVGQIVTMNGYLVNANGPEGRRWNTSLTRSDTGNGACELFYVESAKAVNSLADEM
ncbi:MAG: hypothetical protein ABI318_00205 [Chthoniobacteraceae bacterium]